MAQQVFLGDITLILRVSEGLHEVLEKKCIDEASECMNEFNTRLFQSVPYSRFLYSKVLHKRLEDKSAIPISVYNGYNAGKQINTLYRTDNVQTGLIRRIVSIEEVIKNGNKVLKRTVGTVKQIYEPTSAKEKLDRKNEMKAKGTMLIALPNKDQLKFHSYQDAKFLMEAIEKSISSTIEIDNTANGVSSAHTQGNDVNSTSVDNLSDAVICAFLASQPNSPQLAIEDLEKIDPGDLEEMDLKWEMAMLTIRARRFIKRTCRNLDINGQRIGFDRKFVLVENTTENALIAQDGIGGYDWSYQAEEEHPTNFALMAYTSSGSSSRSDFEVDSYSKTYIKAYASLKEEYDSLSLDYKKSQFNLVSYKAGLQSVEERLAHYKKNEVVFEEKINVLNLEVKLRDNALVKNQKKLEKAEKESDELKPTLEKFQNSSKSLNNLLESQVYDKFKTGLGYNAASPTVERNFMPPKPDQMFIDEQVESMFVDVVASSEVNTVESKHETVNKGFEPKDEVKTVRSSIEKIKFVKAAREKAEKIQVYNGLDPQKSLNLSLYVQGNLQQKEYKEKGVIDSGSSRHMTGNKCYLTEYEDYDGGFVSFGDGKGRISGKGKIKTGTLDFDDVYFFKELKYNLFSVLQMCDKKKDVLFTDTECLVLSSNFKLLNESQVLLRVPRKDNIYSVDLKSVVPTRGLTCLFAKAIIDESNLWHRRLGHINYKTMNKLVRENLVRGLPSKIFENDHSCVACQKGKQHKASYKAKRVNSISKPLHMLHMDLFGPTNVKSLIKKSHFLVVTDDFSRFSWAFFLATKDKTSGILKTFITGIENQLDCKVKVIRCDNGTEFQNSVMNQFCDMKGIRREFSVARTPQQNGVAERKNRTLIEATRTMLVDSKLPTTFWAEAVNTACYVLNRALVIKPHNKIPYELISLMEKLMRDFFVRYSVVSKAMRVFNKRTRIVEEILNIRFLENALNVKGNGLDWLFDVDSLTISMNYVPVVTQNQTNGIAGTKDNIVASQAKKKKAPDQEYIMIPFCITDPLISQGPKDSDDDAGNKPTEVDENEASDNGEHNEQAIRSKLERLLQQEKQTEHINSTNNFNTVCLPVSTAGPSYANTAPSSLINAAGTPATTSNAFEEHSFE
ncbi:putative ribonuclease H-like domain-containing protein [Tanacetum coccineum]